MLLPMYFLIGVSGGPRREYAAIKFFLFTLVGSVLMLVALLMLYFASDLRKLAPEQRAGLRVDGSRLPAEPRRQPPRPMHTFNILALTAMGQISNSPFNQILLWGHSIQLVGVPAVVRRIRR